MSKKLISSNDSESSKALFGTIIENQHIQSTVINDLSDRLDKMDTRIDSLGTSGDINTNNALIQNDLSVKKDTNDSAVGYKTVLGNDMDLGVGKFQSKFLRGNGSGLFSSNVNAIYYDLWSPVINTDPLVPPHHVRLIHPEIKLAHQTPSYTSENVGNYNTFQIGPLGTSNIDSTGSIIPGNDINNNYFKVNLRENVDSTNILSVKMGSVCTQNDGPNISFENVNPDVGSRSEVAYIGAQVLTDSDGDQGSLVFKTLSTNTDNGTTVSECSEKLRINNVGAIGIGGTNFGDANAVLTSNGNAASVIWTNDPIFNRLVIQDTGSGGGIDINRIGGFANINIINSSNNHLWRFAGPGQVNSDINDSNGLLLEYADGPLGQPGTTEYFNCHFNSNGSLSIRNSFFGNKTITVSDDRLKFNEEIINNGLETILQLNPTKYDKSLVLNVEENTEREAGFIAQEVFKIPELKPYVIEGNQEHPWRINYTCIIPYLVSAIKELKMQVEELKK